MAAILGAILGVLFPFAGAGVLSAAGFGAAGVTTGSIAAGLQGAATASGSAFAVCQSLVATGALYSSSVVASSTVAGAAVGAALGEGGGADTTDKRSPKKYIKAD
eukprot:Nitzschia sp. Nitz4//scaffold133_size116822//98684//98998//NITZ4_003822-RA/size116822-processed-gene-0.67-mRNA-1//-1//CDS//3329535441//4138//frame0